MSNARSKHETKVDMLSDRGNDFSSTSYRRQGSTRVWFRALPFASVLIFFVGCSSSEGPATEAELRSSSACRTLSNYARNGIPALYIDEGSALLSELANDFFTMGRQDISNGIQQVINLTYGGPLGQIQAKTKLSQLSLQYCSARGSGPATQTIGEAVVETPTLPPTTAPIPTTTTTTLSPDAIREIARQGFEQIPEYDASVPSVMFEACNTTFGFISDDAYVLQYQFSSETKNWTQWRILDFQGPVLGMQLFEFTGDNVPEVFVTVNYRPENQTFGIVLSHWPDRCESWRKTTIYSPRISFGVTAIVNPILNGSTLIGGRDGPLYSYVYDPAQDLIVESLR